MRREAAVRAEREELSGAGAFTSGSDDTPLSYRMAWHCLNLP